MDSVFMFDPLLEPSPNEIPQEDESDDDYDFIPVSVLHIITCIKKCAELLFNDDCS